jgi:bifunctional DNA-binding transcriptional regulator/antitoxin component of YhaV-PrlF toxin-antitoxin module
MACQRGRTILDVTPIHEVGLERRTNRIRIGSHPRRAHIRIEGLRPVEFIVMEEDDKVVLKDAKSKALRETFGTIAPREVSTSNPQIILWIGANLPNMKKVRCQ